MGGSDDKLMTNGPLDSPLDGRLDWRTEGRSGRLSAGLEGPVRGEASHHMWRERSAKCASADVVGDGVENCAIVVASFGEFKCLSCTLGCGRQRGNEARLLALGQPIQDVLVPAGNMDAPGVDLRRALLEHGRERCRVLFHFGNYGIHDALKDEPGDVGKRVTTPVLHHSDLPDEPAVAPLVPALNGLDDEARVRLVRRPVVTVGDVDEFRAVAVERGDSVEAESAVAEVDLDRVA